MRLKVEAERIAAIAAMDQLPRIAQLGVIFDPVTIAVVGHDPGADLAGGFKDERIGGGSLVDDKDLSCR